LPIVPLIAWTFLDASGARALIGAPYAVEYLPFVLAASLLGLARLAPRGQAAAVVVMVLGSVISVGSTDLPMRLSSSVALLPELNEYRRAIGFTSCAAADRPLLATDFSFSAYPRGRLDMVWFDAGRVPVPGVAVPAEQWARFGTLVYPTDPIEPRTLSNYPSLAADLDAARYDELLGRLDSTATVQRWTYRGGQRLADCAAAFGYSVTVTGGG
jgi:hypothetical protein